MTASILDLPKRSFDGNGRRLAGSWPGVPERPGIALVLAHTPITFISAAQWSWSEGDAVPSRQLATTNLVLYHAGRRAAWIAGTECPIAPGTMIITPRAWVQRVRHQPGHPFRASSVHAQLPVFGGQEDLFAVLGVPCCLEVDPQADAVVVHATAELARLDACRPPGWAAVAQANLVLLVHHLVQRCGDGAAGLPEGADAARLAPALALIDAHLADGAVSLADLARAVGLSPVATRRLFHRLTGLPPNRFVQRRRVDRACHLLRTSGAAVNEIARAVGCADAPVFHRLFRRWTGTTPDGWRSGADR